MSSQYDRLGREFGELEGLPIRRYVELFSFFEVLGDIEGKAVLDAGCGTGIYTRLIKQRGAARVVGLDLCGEMIRAARAAEEERPLEIEYAVGDLARAGALGPFDVVTVGYVLHHAATAEEMLAMCRGVHDALAPGGRFVGTMMSYAFDATDPEYYRPYGFSLEHDGSLRDGSPLSLIIASGRIQITVRARYWTRGGYESALAEAGLSGVRWHPPRVSPAGIEAHGEAFWEQYMVRPHELVLECVRSPG
jgi:SAM-dependent methyltransferase